MENNKELKEIVDNFGNLALISDSLNSQFSNHDFNRKKGIYLEKIKNKNNLESLKLLLVFGKDYRKEEEKKKDEDIDDIEIVKRHHQEMIDLLSNNLKTKTSGENR